MLVKVCGMTSKNDIDICAENDVNIVGFLLQPPSNSYDRMDMLPLKVAKELISYVPSSMESCLLIHLHNIDTIVERIKELKPTMIQIQKQSKLSIEDVKHIKEIFPELKITKTFYVKENIDFAKLVNEIKVYIDSKLIDFVLLDSEVGGSGEVHNWDVSAYIIKKTEGFPILLAGGLNPNNITSAIDKVQPYGLDVMSGVSTKQYNKDKNKLKLFIKNSKAL